MITYFPEPYEDELAYSLFARFYMKSGYTTLRDVMDVLYVNKWYRADTLFFNKLKPEVVDIITQNISMQEFVERHTMFPYYARFIKKERREKAVQSMIIMDGNYHNLLPIPNSIHDRYLRYCPDCVKYDRENHGETYWHRIHQMDGINVCPIHKCMLVNSSIAVGVKESAGLITTEQEVGEVVPEYSYDEIQNKLSEYVMMVFLADVNYEADGIGSFLRNNLSNKYLSGTGVIVKMTEIYKELNSFYKMEFDEEYLQRIQKIFNGYRWNSFEICLLALFLSVSVNELVDFKSNNQDLLKDTYIKLADKYDMEYEVISAIGKDIISDYEKSFVYRKSGVKKKKWIEMDEYYLPIVKNTIQQAVNNQDQRPVKICSYWVCRQINITSKQMDKLSKCKEVIDSYKETQEHYWAREIIWAVNQVRIRQVDLCWRRLRELTNMRKVNCLAALPYIKDMIDENTYELIRNIL